MTESYLNRWRRFGVLKTKGFVVLVLAGFLAALGPIPSIAYDVVPVEKEVKTDDPDVAITERLPVILGLPDPGMAGTVNELIRYIYDQFYITRQEDRARSFLSVDYEVTLKTGRFLSLKITASEYFREAAHPLNHIDAITLDLEEGAVLALEDLFVPGSNFRQRINAFIRQQLSRTDTVGEPLIPLISPFRGITHENPFYMTAEGVVVFFPEYEYTPHSWGALEVEVPYALLEDIMVSRDLMAIRDESP